MQILEQKEVTLGDNRYLITAMDAMYGLTVMNQLASLESSGTTTPPATMVRDVIAKSVKINNMQPDEKLFNKHFARNYKELMELFSEIIKFNFGEDEEGPNVQGDTSETE